jgi:hypothetical protein
LSRGSTTLQAIRAALVVVAIGIGIAVVRNITDSLSGMVHGAQTADLVTPLGR